MLAPQPRVGAEFILLAGKALEHYEGEGIKVRHISMKACLDEEKKQMKYKEYYGEVDGNATERLTDIIEKIMLSNDSYEAKLIPTKFSWKNYLYHFVLRLFIRLKIFDIVKFPKSAYAHKNDIPFYRTDLG